MWLAERSVHTNHDTAKSFKLSLSYLFTELKVTSRSMVRLTYYVLSMYMSEYLRVWCIVYLLCNVVRGRSQNSTYCTEEGVTIHSSAIQVTPDNIYYLQDHYWRHFSTVSQACQARYCVILFSVNGPAIVIIGYIQLGWMLIIPLPFFCTVFITCSVSGHSVFSHLFSLLYKVLRNAKVAKVIHPIIYGKPTPFTMCKRWGQSSW